MENGTLYTLAFFLLSFPSLAQSLAAFLLRFHFVIKVIFAFSSHRLVLLRPLSLVLQTHRMLFSYLQRLPSF